MHAAGRRGPRTARFICSVQAADGSKQEIVTEHVIAATGYKVDLERLKFLNPEIRSKVKTVNGAPVLSSTFESSVPGLYFAGVAAANSFGPVMRFAFGAGFAARTLTRSPGEVSLPRDDVGSGSQRGDEREVNDVDRVRRLMDE